MLPRLLSLVSGQEWWWLIIVGCAILHHFAYCHKLLSLNSICTCLYHFEYVHCVWSCVPLPATLVVSIAFSQPPLVLHMLLNLSVYSEDATWKTAFGYSINVRSLIQWYPFNTNFSLLSTCLLLRRLNLLLQMEMKMKTSISYSYILFFFLSFPTSSVWCSDTWSLRTKRSLRMKGSVLFSPSSIAYIDGPWHASLTWIRRSDEKKIRKNNNKSPRLLSKFSPYFFFDCIYYYFIIFCHDDD